MNLKDAIDMLADIEQFDWSVDGEKVEFIDEWGLGLSTEGFYLCGHEFGATHLIHAQSEEDAWEEWVDNLGTIPKEEIHEAYNAYDKLLDYMEGLGYDNDSHLRGFCNRWADFYFSIKSREDGAFDEWPLDESYEMQSSATGTGIVDMGHYAWIRQIDISSIHAERKLVPTS